MMIFFLFLMKFQKFFMKNIENIYLFRNFVIFFYINLIILYDIKNIINSLLNNIFLIFQNHFNYFNPKKLR